MSKTLWTYQFFHDGEWHEYCLASEVEDRVAETEAANKYLAGQLANHKLQPGVVQASDLANGLDELWIAWAENQVMVDLALLPSAQKERP